MLKPYFCYMHITNELVEKLAVLSRLHFSDAEKDAIKGDLQKMIGFVDKLNKLDTTGVEPLLHINSNTNIYRNDETQTTVNRHLALQNAPVKDEQFFKVPKVIKK